MELTTGGMGIEIERKFKVCDKAALPLAEAVEVVEMKQGYVMREPGRTLRIRMENGRYVVNFKARQGEGIGRWEFEHEVGPDEGETLLALCRGRGMVEKTRYVIPCDGGGSAGSAGSGGRHWEIDIFGGENEGLIVAEIELEREDEVINRPAWLGEEVTHDTRYLNVSLAERPYRTWGED